MSLTTVSLFVHAAEDGTIETGQTIAAGAQIIDLKTKLRTTARAMVVANGEVRLTEALDVVAGPNFKEVDARLELT